MEKGIERNSKQLTSLSIDVRLKICFRIIIALLRSAV